MKETIYIKKYIKSEDDLPNKAGDYFFCYKDSTRETRFAAIHYYTSRGDIIFWLKQVDWYLQEVELPTDEEIVIAESISTYIIKPDASSFELLSQGFRDGVRWLISKLKGNG